MKRILKACMYCQQFNARPVKLSQKAYRELLLNPEQICFKLIFLDHLGPFRVRHHNFIIYCSRKNDKK